MASWGLPLSDSKKKLRMLGAKVQRTKIGDSELRVGEWDVGLRYPTSSRFRNPTEFQKLAFGPWQSSESPAARDTEVWKASMKARSSTLTEWSLRSSAETGLRR